MTKAEFLEKLRKALGNDLTGPVIRENVDYYRQYIEDEVRKGRSEEEVTGELGDPWVIAQTIINVTGGGNGAGQSGVYESGEAGYGQQDYGRQQGYRGQDGGYERGSRANRNLNLILVLLIIIVVMLLALTVVGGILRFIAPILLPVLLISALIRMFRK